jgi:hypothetical protein
MAKSEMIQIEVVAGTKREGSIPQILGRAWDGVCDGRETIDSAVPEWNCGEAPTSRKEREKWGTRISAK